MAYCLIVVVVEANYELARISQTTPSWAGQKSVKYESAQILLGDGVLKHSKVDKIEQIRSLPAIDSRSRNEFEKCGLTPSVSSLHLVKNCIELFESKIWWQHTALCI